MIGVLQGQSITELHRGPWRDIPLAAAAMGGAERKCHGEAGGNNLAAIRIERDHLDRAVDCSALYTFAL